MKAKTQSTDPRYIIKFRNGVWVIFDTLEYRHVRAAGTKKEIDRIYKEG